ncbi:hypothetical protein GGS23DRAFT_599701 [Durotheca rogersii]|uniref:uncharacterized protein n=1 Tax=Durotheca rogersii TaxID=419775 RepID=UPI00221E8C67|nr:uncharacterized protein GGS23DRAFT_599701 [Durotheca rogersii]KAI5860040.1 hypothetical protein GGS23DRAFT_599701 [Durotheca rogersii]
MQPRNLLTFFSAVALASASPLRRRCDGHNETITPPTTPAPPPAAVPTLPSTGSGTQLESPGAATLKHILVGHGIQNYTCAADGTTAASFGALAVVWDITALYPGTGAADALSPEEWDGLTSKVLRTTPLPLNLAAGAGNGGADAAAPFPAPANLTVEGVAAPLPFLGHHFFDAANTPTFALAGGAELFKGKRDAGIPAPADADAGADPATGAVDWLRLSDKAGASVGVSLVYRVLTAGGNPEPCAAAGQPQSVPYTAQYWIYGN